MKRVALLLSSLVALVAASTTVPAHAVGRLVDLMVVDRESGETLTPVRYRGEWWIAGKPGARYAVTLSNRSDQRTLGVLSIDGVNAINGDTAAWSQSGYVLDPRGSAQVNGWRKSNEQVAAFEFTALPDSYAARTGRPGNVGVIGIAVFHEKPVVAQAKPAPMAPAPASRGTADDSVGRLFEGRIGTGHGAVEDSAAMATTFDRRQGTPDEIVMIRYDRMENLVAMGIVAAPSPRLVGDAFPASRRFVPDPPARR